MVLLKYPAARLRAHAIHFAHVAESGGAREVMQMVRTRSDHQNTLLINYDFGFPRQRGALWIRQQESSSAQSGLVRVFYK